MPVRRSGRSCKISGAFQVAFRRQEGRDELERHTTGLLTELPPRVVDAALFPLGGSARDGHSRPCTVRSPDRSGTKPSSGGSQQIGSSNFAHIGSNRVELGAGTGRDVGLTPAP
jgi:hypothetical protein